MILRGKMRDIENIKKIISEIVEKIKNEYLPEKIILYGSFAYGNPTDDSDIDLLIIKETEDRLIDRRLVVRKIVSNPKRYISFQPLVVTPAELNKRLQMGDQFFEEILAKGRVLYAR